MTLLNKSKKVAVALSGGVDSSVALAILKQQGFEAIGIHMRLWKAKSRSRLCSTGGAKSSKANQCENEKRIKEIGKALGVKVFIFDLQREFKKIVVDYFLTELKTGNTPNPCVVCNKQVKFGLLMKKAREMGCDYLATGHYAQTRSQKTKSGDFNHKPKIVYKILEAKNLSKDQSYFLWQINQNQLKHILFPLGAIESKQKVREIAKSFGLPTYKTPASNDICFLAQTNLQEFFTKESAEVGVPQAGNIVDMRENILGKHNGLCFYTIGQRKGINIPVKKGGKGFPWFVVKKDIKQNRLIISQEEKDLQKKELTAVKVNWISGIEPVLPLKVLAKVRYGAELSPAVVKEKIGSKKYKIVFTKSQRAVTQGQSVVFYLPRRIRQLAEKADEGKELLGGGIID